QRAPDCRIDGADRSLQHEYPRARGAPDRPASAFNVSANASVRATPARKVLVVEDDVFLRLLEVVLDPAARGERRSAFADFFAHDEPDFEGWCARVRKHAGELAPAEVRLVETQAELRAQLGHADAVVVESLALGTEELAAAPRLKAVQKYGVGLRNIDTAAVAARGI